MAWTVLVHPNGHHEMPDFMTIEMNNGCQPPEGWKVLTQHPDLNSAQKACQQRAKTARKIVDQNRRNAVFSIAPY